MYPSGYDELDHWQEYGHVHMGSAHSEQMHEGLDPEDRVELWRERQEKLARRRPTGFTAIWPEGAPKPIRPKRRRKRESK